MTLLVLGFSGLITARKNVKKRQNAMSVVGVEEKLNHQNLIAKYEQSR